MRYTLEFSETALADIEKHKKAGDKAVLKKIEKLLQEPTELPDLRIGTTENIKTRSCRVVCKKDQ